jgi:hypothetical protein
MTNALLSIKSLSIDHQLAAAKLHELVRAVDRFMRGVRSHLRHTPLLRHSRLHVC